MLLNSPLKIEGSSSELVLKNYLSCSQIVKLKDFFYKNGNRNHELSEQMFLKAFNSILAKDSPSPESICLIFRQLDASVKGLGLL
jgi:hypothetical protein